MAKTQEGKESAKSDGLEIISIGSLYKGHWDKKYWSSSRGKDRYPYPVGYQAIRVYSGSTYKTEIHEGPKGPLFMISCDGQSCSGQTPDIAWEKFQKTACPHLKLWHGKRFSCKIDGVEFFGFKNPFIQRLLRELVANVNGTAERSLLYSSFCNGASTMEHDNRSPTSTVPELLPHLDRPPTRKKRSSRCEIMQSVSANGPGLKRPRSKGLINDAMHSILAQGNQIPKTHTASKDENGNFSGALALSVMEGSNSSATDSILLKTVDFSDHDGENEAQSKFISSQNAECKEANSASKRLDRSEDAKLEGVNIPIKTDDTFCDSLVQNESLGIYDVHLCAPDTLDFQDDWKNVPSSVRDTTRSLKEELTATSVVNSDGMVTVSRQEEELGTSNSNTGSERSDYDSVGQLMMTVLLPQAIPLLNVSSKKIRDTFTPRNALPHVANSQKDNIETNHLLNLPSSGIILSEDAHADQEKRKLNQSLEHDSVEPNLEHMNCVILDSFEDDEGGKHVAKEALLYTHHSNTEEQLVSINPKQETSICCDEIYQTQDAICHKEANMASYKKPHESDASISKSILGGISPTTKAISEDIQADILKESVEKDHKDALYCAKVVDANDNLGGIDPVRLSGNDSSVETTAFETSSSYQAKVYTRKKVSKHASSTRKYTGPHSESIICRNSRDDGYAPNKSGTTGSLVSKSCYSVVDEPCNRDTFGATDVLERQLDGLPAEKTTTNCESEMTNVPPGLSNKSQILACVSKEKNASCLLDPSALVEREFQENCHKERVEHKIIVENDCSALCQNQVTSFYEKNRSIAREVQGSSDVNRNWDVELNSDLRGIVNLIGGYSHPLPISSVLLATKGSDIDICVFCGLPGQKERTLFIYKISIEQPMIGHPSFVGHTLVALPFSGIDLERCGLQFTPGGQCLVLLDSIKAPYCREGSMDCVCSICSSGCLKDNAVKVVQVNPGYVSLVTKLETVESVQCILVLEINYLVAAGKSGRLHSWVMNSTWSKWTEEFIMPAGNCRSSCVVELKRIPKCDHLVIGHNGFGDFVVWDILKRVIISRFSASGEPINHFLPISLLSWQPGFNYANLNECIDKIISATKFWFSENMDCSFIPSEGEDIAVWLLISIDYDAQYEHIPSKFQSNPSRWRLALLVKDRVILGSTLDPRAVAIGASFDHGIMGSDDGLVYMWEFSTGTVLGVLHHFKGSNVSCIATDDLRPDILAVAADDGQLLIYLHNQENFAIK